MPNIPRIQPKRPRLVELLAFPQVQILDVTGPLQVFATANDIAGGNGPAYAIQVVSQAGGAVASSSGVALLAYSLPPLDAALDTLIVAGGPGIEAAAADEALVDWVRGRARQARRFASVCTGAVLLATSGLLDGRRAATHWSLCSELARRFPSVQVEPDPIFVHDGPAWTSAGVTAGIDLALALVEEDLGRAIALAVARYLVVFLKRPGGQAASVLPPLPVPAAVKETAPVPLIVPIVPIATRSDLSTTFVAPTHSPMNDLPHEVGTAPAMTDPGVEEAFAMSTADIDQPANASEGGDSNRAGAATMAVP